MARKPTGTDGNAEIPPVAKPARRPRARKPAVREAIKVDVEPDQAPPANARKPRDKASAPPTKTAAKPRATGPVKAAAKAPVKPRKPRAKAVPPPADDSAPSLPAVAAPTPVQPEPVEPSPVALTDDPSSSPAAFADPAPTIAATAPAAPEPAAPADMAHGLSPVDLPEPEGGERDGLGWMTSIILLSSVLLLLFNSFAIDKWARALTPSTQNIQIVDAATAWHTTMQRFGLTVPLESGRSAYHWVRDRAWPGAGGEDDAVPTVADTAPDPAT